MECQERFKHFYISPLYLENCKSIGNGRGFLHMYLGGSLAKAWPKIFHNPSSIYWFLRNKSWKFKKLALTSTPHLKVDWKTIQQLNLKEFFHLFVFAFFEWYFTWVLHQVHKQMFFPSPCSSHFLVVSSCLWSWLASILKDARHSKRLGLCFSLSPTLDVSILSLG